MYAAVLFIGIQNGQTVQPIVDVERTVFYREKAAGMYSALPYAFSQVWFCLNELQHAFLGSLLTLIQSMQVLIEIPHIFLQTVIYGLIVYSLIGFDWTVEKFFWYLFFMFFTFMYFTYYGMMAVAMTPNSDIAAIVSTAFYAIWNIFAGFLVPRPVSYTELYAIKIGWLNVLSRTEVLKLSFACYRKFLCGGDGILGLARWRGHCTDWLLLSLVTTHIRWTTMRPCRTSSGDSLGSGMTSWVL